MGQVFSGPVTYKDSGDGESKFLGLTWGYSGMQGWRDRMEDAHLAMSSVDQSSSSKSSVGENWNQTALFGVMDGHGGENVAQFCKHHLPAEISSENPQDVGSALVRAFHRMDELLSSPEHSGQLQQFSNDMSPAAFKSWQATPDCMGCTAVVCCIRPKTIIVANAGDSRAVLCRYGRAVELSEDHKPNLPKEHSRITRAGGVVIEQRVAGHVHYRVNGNLNLSRSIGDLVYKQNANLCPQEQLIICNPDIRHIDRVVGDEFLILACDGVWDVLSSQGAVDFVRSRLGDRTTLLQRLEDGELKLSTIIEEMLDSCLSPDLAQTMGLGGDNMTAILIVFTGQPPKEWADPLHLLRYRQSWCS